MLIVTRREPGELLHDGKRTEVQLAPRSVVADSNHQHHVSTPAEANLLGRMVCLDLNCLPVRGDSVIPVGAAACLRESVMIYSDQLPVIAEQIAKPCPLKLRSQHTERLLGREDPGENVLDRSNSLCGFWHPRCALGPNS